MSTSVASLLAGPLSSVLSPWLIPDDAREIRQATLLEDVAMTEALRPGAIAVLSRAVQFPGGGYQLDVLVRQAAEREVAALVLHAGSRRSLTAESLARRGRVALLEVDQSADPMQVVHRLGAAVSGDAAAALVRLATAAAYRPGPTANMSTMLSELSELCGMELRHAETDLGAPVLVDGRAAGSIVSPDIGDAPQLACHIAAAIVSRVLSDRDRDIMGPLRSSAAALAQVVLCAPSLLGQVAERAVEAGLPVHGWHCAVRLALEAPDDTEDATLVRVGQDLAALIARRQRDHRAVWTIARPDASLLLVRTTRTDPGRASEQQIRRAVGDWLAELSGDHPARHFRIGIGAAHDGATGLRTSAEEAGIALASAKFAGGLSSIATFDSLGLRRILAEWLVTDTARETVKDLLAPLDELGPEKAAVAIETLHAYLDERGSLQNAAKRLNVHRNAVVYRMSQISARLPHDLADPDQRFALQLACRARLMSAGR